MGLINTSVNDLKIQGLSAPAWFMVYNVITASRGGRNGRRGCIIRGLLNWYRYVPVFKDVKKPPRQFGAKNQNIVTISPVCTDL